MRSPSARQASLRNGRYQQTFGVKKQARAEVITPIGLTPRDDIRRGRLRIVLPVVRRAREASPLFRDVLAAQSPFPAAAIWREVGRHFQLVFVSRAWRCSGSKSWPRRLRCRCREMAGISKLLALKSRRGPHAIPHIGLAPPGRRLEGGETSGIGLAVVRARLGSNPHAPTRVLAARSFPSRELEGRAANSLALRRIPICADWRRHAVSRDSCAARCPRLSPKARGTGCSEGAG